MFFDYFLEWQVLGGFEPYTLGTMKVIAGVRLPLPYFDWARKLSLSLVVTAFSDF